MGEKNKPMQQVQMKNNQYILWAKSGCSSSHREAYIGKTIIYKRYVMEYGFPNPKAILSLKICIQILTFIYVPATWNGYFIQYMREYQNTTVGYNHLTLPRVHVWLPQFMVYVRNLPSSRLWSSMQGMIRLKWEHFVSGICGMLLPFFCYVTCSECCLHVIFQKIPLSSWAWSSFPVG